MSPASDLELSLFLGRSRVRVNFASAALRTGAEARFRPALAQDSALFSQEEPDAEIRVTEESAEIVRGPDTDFTRNVPPLSQLESLLLNWGPDLDGGRGVLHAGAVRFEGHVVLFIAPSGSGKSTLTLAALDAGAEYITDDTVHVYPDCISGFARAVHFDPVELGSNPLPAYLKRMDLELVRFERNGVKYALPVDPTPRRSLQQAFFSPESPPVVVTVKRGEDSVASLSQLDRVKVLHEAAIVKHGEYDGSLGPGPAFSLSWSEPNRAFSRLRQELARCVLAVEAGSANP